MKKNITYKFSLKSLLKIFLVLFFTGFAIDLNAQEHAVIDATSTVKSINVQKYENLINEEKADWIKNDLNSWMNKPSNIQYDNTNLKESWLNKTGVYSCYHPNRWTEKGVYYPYKPGDEVFENRTQDSKTFKNSDGSFTAVFLSDLHYQDAEGHWRDVDLSLTSNTSGKYNNFNLCNQKNNFHTFINTNNISDGIIFEKEKGGYSINFMQNPQIAVINADNSLNRIIDRQDVNGIVSDDNRIVTYEGIYPNITEEVVMLKRGIEHGIKIGSADWVSDVQGGHMVFKENITLPEGWQVVVNGRKVSSDFNANDFAIIMPDGKDGIRYCPVKIYDGSVSYDEIMKRAEIPPVEVLVSENDTSKPIPRDPMVNLIYKSEYSVHFVNGIVEVSYSVPIEWLISNDRVFPVYVDPPVELLTGYTLYTSGDSYMVPYNTYYHDARYQSLYLATDLTGAGMSGVCTITALDFYVSEVPGMAVSNFRIRLQNTAAATQTTFVTTGWTSCYGPTNIGQPAVGWKSYTLSTTFNWDGTSKLLLDLSRDNAGWTDNGEMYVRGTIDSRVACTYHDSGWPWPYDAATLYGWSYLPSMKITYTAGCTTPGTPTANNPTGVTQTHADFSWSAGSPAGDPTVTYYWAVGTGSGVTYDSGYTDRGTTTGTTASTDALSASTTYYFRLKACTSCDASCSGYSSFKQFNTLAPDYCDAGATNCDEYISRVQVGSIDNSTDCDFYSDYTAQSTTMSIGTGYATTVTNGNGWDGDQCGIWVDWNQDYDFDDPNETISVSGTPGLGPYTATITPPGGASIGNTRMRIRICYTTGLDACGTATYGEVEDYTINVSSACTDGLWTGATSTNWSTPSNWDCGNEPDQTIDVTIPLGCTNYPSLTASEYCKNITIQNGGSLTISNASGVLWCYGDFTVQAGATLNHTDGWVEMYGNTNNTISVSNPSVNTFYRLHVRKAAAKVTANSDFTCSQFNISRDAASGISEFDVNGKTITTGIIIIGDGTDGNPGKLTMSSGTIVSNGSVCFYHDGSENVTGGTIKCSADFQVAYADADFTPTGGTVEMSGTGISNSGTLAFYNLNINKPGGTVWLFSNNVSISGGAGALTLTAGLLRLQDYDLTLSNTAATIGGTPDATKMVVTDGTGKLRKYFTTGDTPLFTFPIGEVTGTTEYSPVSIDFSANTAAGYVGVKVTDATHPNNGSPTDYLSRYWSFTTSGITTYTYSMTCYYVDADVNGTEANLKTSRWDASTWTELTSSVTPASNYISFTGLANTVAPLNANDYTGRVNPISCCIAGTAYLTVTAPTDNVELQISSCTYAGEYNTIQSVVSGQTYQFRSDIVTDWLSLTNTGNTCLTYGTTPITWVATFSGDVRLHVHTNSSCGTDASCHYTYIQCTSCPAPCTAPTIDAKADGLDSKTICTGSSVTLTGGDGGDGSDCSGSWEYGWYTGAGGPGTWYNGSVWTGNEAYNTGWEDPGSVSPASTTTYTVKVRCDAETGCNNTDAVTVTVDENPTTADAGSDQNVCAATATLAGNNPAVGTGTWTLQSGTGTITTPGSYNSGVTGLVVGSAVFRWTISNGVCTDSYEEVTITRDEEPTTADAGTDQSVCNNTATLAGNTPTTGTGTWTLQSGTGTITTPGSPTSGLTGLGYGDNVFRWTISNGVCTDSWNDVTVSYKKTLFEVGSAQEYPTITLALNDVSTIWGTDAFNCGDVTVDVYNGTYTEDVVPNSNLNPQSGNRLIIQAHSGESPVIDATGQNIGIHINNIDYVTVSGLEVKNANTHGIYVGQGTGACDHNIVQYCKSHDNGQGGSSGDGIKVYDEDVTVQNNLCYDNYGDGISVYQSGSTCTITNNTCYGNGHQVTGETILSENWESGTTGWTLESGTNAFWERHTCSAHNGSYGVGINDGYGTNCDYPWDVAETGIDCYHTLDLTNYISASLTFWWKCDGDATDYGQVLIDGTPVSGTLYDQETYVQHSSINLDSYCGSSHTLQFRFKNDGAYSGDPAPGFCIDDISVTGDKAAIGSAFYIDGGTGQVVTNNIFQAKTGGDYYATYVNGDLMSTSSGYNNQYATGSKLCWYGSDKNLTEWNDCAWSTTNDDISGDPLFVTAGSDFHLQSTADHATGNVWPPTSNGTGWATDGSDSPSLDAGTGAVGNEPSPNGGIINQGCYGGTVQASKTFVPTDDDSKAEDPTTQVAANTISSIIDTDAEAQEVFSFKITDLGTSDGVATKVTQITIKPGNNNNADWTDHIQGVKLHNGTSWVTIGSPTITDNDITIPITSGNLDIADGTSTTCTLYVYLNTSNIVDGAILDFRIDYDAHGFTADGAGSVFAANFGSADIEGNNITVVVIATKLVFDEANNRPPSLVQKDSYFLVAVGATDVNGNLDVDEASSVTLALNTGAGTLSTQSNFTQNLSGGVYLWNDIAYDTEEVCFTIKAESATLTNAVTGCIECLGVPGSFSMTAPINTAGCADNVNISWGTPAGTVDSYVLFYCEGTDCDPELSGTYIIGVTSTYVFDASSYNNDTLRFKIKAVNSAGFTWSTNVAEHRIYQSGSWSGTVSTAWNNASNWCGSVPGSSDDVTISSGAPNYPVLNVDANVKDITIESGASLGLGSYTMNVYGDWDNNGTLTPGTGTVVFMHATDDQTVDNGNQAFYNFTVNKASGTVDIENNTLDVNGNLSITAGTLHANDQDIEVAGNWTDNGTFNAGAGTVTFDGSGTSILTRTTSGNNSTILDEDWEDGTAGWTLGSYPTVTEWRRLDGDGSYTPHSGSYDCGVYDLSTSTEYDYCTSIDALFYVDLYTTFDLTDYSDATLDFWWRNDCYTGLQVGAALYVYIDGDLIDTYSSESTWQNVSGFDLTSYCGNGEHSLIFKFFKLIYGGNGDRPAAAVDDITITANSNVEFFNNFVINKTSGGVQLNLSFKTTGDVSILSGTLDQNGRYITCSGDWTNNGSFIHNNGSTIFNGISNQTIKGSSNTVFYNLKKNTSSDLIIGDVSNSITVEAENDFEWQDNDDKISVGNGQTTNFIIDDDLYIKQGCELELNNTSTTSIGKNYRDYGTLTHNNTGVIKFHGADNSFVVKEPTQIIFSDDFETVNPDWVLDDIANHTGWRRHSGYGHNSNYDMATRDNKYEIPHDYDWGLGDGYDNTYDASIDIDLSGYDVAILSFWLRAGGGYEGASLYDYGQVIIDDGSENVIFDELYGMPFWTEYSQIDISEYCGDEITLIFRWQFDDGGVGNSPGFCVDDILITTNSINEEEFYDITINKTAANGYTLLLGPIDVNGDVLVSDGDFNSGANDFPVAGNWTNNTANNTTFTHQNNTITFDGTGAQTIDIGNTEFYNVIIDKASGTASISTSTLDIDNDLTITSGTLNANNQDIEIDGDWLNNGGTFTPQTQTVNFIGTSDQQIKSNGSPFWHIIMNKDGSLTLTDDIDINGHLTLTQGVFDVTSGNRSIHVAGDWVNNGGNFSKHTGMVTFDGTATQSVNKDAGGTVNMNDFSFYNVTIDGNEVILFYDSDNYLLIINNLVINSGKVVKGDDE